MNRPLRSCLVSTLVLTVSLLTLGCGSGATPDNPASGVAASGGVASGGGTSGGEGPALVAVDLPAGVEVVQNQRIPSGQTLRLQRVAENEPGVHVAALQVITDAASNFKPAVQSLQHRMDRLAAGGLASSEVVGQDGLTYRLLHTPPSEANPPSEATDDGSGKPGMASGGGLNSGGREPGWYALGRADHAFVFFTAPATWDRSAVQQVLTSLTLHP